jgi:hypothetical protein
MKTITVSLIFFLFSEIVFAQDMKKPTPPTPPTEPTKPVVPGAPEKIESPRLPILPSLPNINNQSNGPVYEVEKYQLSISGAYPNGNTKNNVSNTINYAQYVRYSNRTVQIKLKFTDGSDYIYHLRNYRSKIETGTSVFRETFDTIVQVGKEFLLEQYLSELYYNNDTITSFNLIGNNKVIVQLVFSKKE